MIRKLKSYLIRKKALGMILNYKKNYFKLLGKFKIPFKYQITKNFHIQLYRQGQISYPIYRDRFESDQIKLFFECITPGMNIVDVGANLGLYSIVAKKKLENQGGKIWAFEPSLNNYHLLLKNLELNHCDNFVAPVNLGLGNTVNEIQILRRDIGYGDAEKYILPRSELPRENLPNINQPVEEEVIKLTTLDAYLVKEKISKVDFIKIDAEGYEYFVLNGAKNILKSSPDVILLFECTELGTARAGCKQKEIFYFLNNLGFNLFYWDKVGNKWGNEESYLYKAGDIWAARDLGKLPILKGSS